VLRSGIDMSPLELTRAGTARYVVNLLAELERIDDLEMRPFRFGGRGRLAKLARDGVWYPALLPLAAGRARLDVLHCTSIRAPLFGRVPVVVTVHDVAPLRHPEAFNSWTRHYTSATLPRIVRSAAAVITVSAFQQRELAALTGVESHVVHQGVGAPFTGDGPAAEGDYVLAVATLEPRKNFPALLEGFGLAGIDCELRVVGESGWGGVEVGGERVRWLGRVDDDELAALYRGARCLLFPSTYEGFGLPVLEAMAAGTAVVCPAGPPYDEFAGGVAVTCDPTDPGSIAAALREAVERHDELAALGRERAASFTWERTAKATADVYRAAAGLSPAGGLSRDAGASTTHASGQSPAGTVPGGE
jgi:glycosyltransferase involved in cell wall biosynthesis